MSKKSISHRTPLFWTKSPEKPNAGKSVQQILGFVLLSSRNFWIHLWIPQGLFGYKEINNGRNNCENTSINHWKIWLIRSLETLALEVSILLLHSYCVGIASPPLGTTYTEMWIDLTLGIIDIILPFSHPGFWLLDKFKQWNLGKPLSHSVAST